MLLRPLPSFSSPPQCAARLVPPRPIGCPPPSALPPFPFFVALLDLRVASPVASAFSGTSIADGISPSPMEISQTRALHRHSFWLDHGLTASLSLPRAVTISLALACDTEVLLPLLYPPRRLRSPVRPTLRVCLVSSLRYSHWIPNLTGRRSSADVAYVQCRRTGRPPLCLAHRRTRLLLQGASSRWAHSDRLLAQPRRGLQEMVARAA